MRIRIAQVLLLVDVSALLHVDFDSDVAIDSVECPDIDNRSSKVESDIELSANGPVNFIDPSAVELLNQPTGREIINTVTIEEVTFSEGGITQF